MVTCFRVGGVNGGLGSDLSINLYAPRYQVRTPRTIGILGQAPHVLQSLAFNRIALLTLRRQESCEVLVTASEMVGLLGRGVFELPEGEARATAIEWLVRRLEVPLRPP